MSLSRSTLQHRRKCIQIPAQPELTKISDRFSLTKFPVVQRYGLIWTSIHGRDITQANIPVLDTWDDAEHQAICHLCGYWWL